MLPPELLDYGSLDIIGNDGPFATAHFHVGIVPREVEFWKEDFGRYFLGCCSIALQRQSEGRIP